MDTDPKTPFKAVPPATLSDALIRFCQCYAVKPYFDHACSESGIRSMGKKKFNRPDVQQYIKDLMEELKERSFKSADDVIREIEKLGFVEIDTKRIKASDKAKALEMLAKKHGMFEKDNEQGAMVVAPQIIIFQGKK